MLSITMHSASVPLFVRQLGAMLVWFDRAEAHAVSRNYAPDAFLALRLSPDMLPFTKQVQIACDAAKLCVARLSGVDAPSFPDDEASLAELRHRVQATLDYLQSVPADRIEGTETKEIAVPRRAGSITMAGEAYLHRFALPNFYFHVTMTYALLRGAGVELGKMDFLGPLQ